MITANLSTFAIIIMVAFSFFDIYAFTTDTFSAILAFGICCTAVSYIGAMVIVTNLLFGAL